MKIEIKSIIGSVLFEYDCENNSLRKTLIEAVNKGADLKGADLKGADLKGADLEGAYLKGADLEGADLKGAYLKAADLKRADLEGADLKGAYLEGADLKRADLEGADLKGAYLKAADLKGAYLKGAYLEGAYLEGAYLEGADLEPIKNDMFVLLLNAIPEVENLKKSIIDGKIDGSTYEGKCACLCGTLEKSKDKKISRKIYNLRDSRRPIERFFLGIKKGDTPKTSQFSKLALEWLEEFESLVKTA